MRDYKKELHDLLTDCKNEHGEGTIGILVAEVVNTIDWNYNTTDDSLMDIANQCINKITDNADPHNVYQLWANATRVRTQYKDKQ